MTEGVVETLEMIDVDHDEREPRPRREAALEPLVEGASVRDVRHRVEMRQAVEFVARLDEGEQLRIALVDQDEETGRHRWHKEQQHAEVRVVGQHASRQDRAEAEDQLALGQPRHGGVAGGDRTGDADRRQDGDRVEDGIVGGGQREKAQAAPQGR